MNRMSVEGVVERQMLTDFRRRCRIEELCLTSALERAQQDFDEFTQRLRLQRAQEQEPDQNLLQRVDAARLEVEMLERELVRIRTSLRATDEEWTMARTPMDHLFDALDHPGYLT